jgi:predicted O-methyltransferase YrrM
MTLISEATVTKASDHCPHPEWWHAPDGWSTEDEVSEFLGALVRVLQPEFVLEIGTHKAATTEYIERAMHSNGHGRMVSVEINRDLVDSPLQYLSCLPFEMVNVNSLLYTPPAAIDLLFVDGQNDRVADVARFAPRMARYGIIAVHDLAGRPVFREQLVPALEYASTERILLNTPRGLLLMRAAQVVL